MKSLNILFNMTTVEKKDKLNLEELCKGLHCIFEKDDISIEEVDELMHRYDSKDWEKYIMFDDFKYTRNLVDAGKLA